MNEPLRGNARRLIKSGEGSVPHLYLDITGNVTVGVGNLLMNVQAALRLPFIVEATGAPASPAQIESEFNRVARQEAGHPASYYEQFCRLRLPDREIDALLDRRIDEFEAGLRRHFDNFDGFPEQVRLAMLDMAFNLGIAGLINKFPSFARAASAGDWATCARECRRRQVQDTRNEAVKRLFLSAVGPRS